MKIKIAIFTLGLAFSTPSIAASNWGNKQSVLKLGCEIGYGNPYAMPSLIIDFKTSLKSSTKFVKYTTDKGHKDAYLKGVAYGRTGTKLTPSKYSFEEKMVLAMKESNTITITGNVSDSTQTVTLSGFTKAYDAKLEECKKLGSGISWN